MSQGNHPNWGCWPGPSMCLLCRYGNLTTGATKSISSARVDFYFTKLPELWKTSEVWCNKIWGRGRNQQPLLTPCCAHNPHSSGKSLLLLFHLPANLGVFYGGCRGNGCRSCLVSPFLLFSSLKSNYSCLEKVIFSEMQKAMPLIVWSLSGSCDWLM